MAIRSSAGTGVIVSLVVFILISSFLLVMSILFYTGKATEMEKAQEMSAQLDEFARKHERNAEQFQAVEAAAKKERKSVLGYVLDQHNTMKAWVDGNPNASLESIQRRFSTVDEGETLYNAMKDMNRQVTDTGNELTALKSQIASLQGEIDSLTTQVESANSQRNSLLTAESAQLQTYDTFNEEHLAQIADVKQDLQAEKDKLQDSTRDRIRGLEDEVDELREDSVRLNGTIDALEGKRKKLALADRNPTIQPDGSVIDIAGSNDLVYIDRGRDDNAILGMTFEVYEDQSQIRQVQQGNDLIRGKASLQLIKIGQSTSTAKITRSTFGSPVVRGDVIANPIYDPNYQFKFLVHGQFDIDGDGLATEEEAAFLRNQIEHWGGIVVYGDTLPGDLDCLVLGVTPVDPQQPPQSASVLQQQDYRRKQTIYNTYKKLAEQAGNSKIPTLSANRLLILTGSTGR